MGQADMDLLDIMDGKTEAEMTEQTSERLRTLVGEGLDLFERAFGFMHADVMADAAKDVVEEPDSAAPPARSPRAAPDEAPGQRPGSKSGSSEEDGEAHPGGRLKFDEGGISATPSDLALSRLRIDNLEMTMKGMGESQEREMSDALGVASGEMAKIVPHLRKVRRECPGARDRSSPSQTAFFREKFAGPSEVTIVDEEDTESLNLDESLFGTMTLLRHMLQSVPHREIFHASRDWGSKVFVQLNMMPHAAAAEMGFPAEWSDHWIWHEPEAMPTERFEEIYGHELQDLMGAYAGLDADQKAEVDRRTQAIVTKLIENGWNTANSRMKNCLWTARAGVMRSVLGFDDDGRGIPADSIDQARAMANGSEDDDLLNALNDFHAEKTDKDCVRICIPKGASDEVILEKIDRWMKFDLKKCNSDYYECMSLKCEVERNGGSTIAIKNINSSVSMSPAYAIDDDEIHRNIEVFGFAEDFVKRMEAVCTDTVRALREEDTEKNKLRLIGAFRHALVTRIGESGIVKVIYQKDGALWPREIIVDLDRANPAFKAEIEDGYRFRDPAKVGCGPYVAYFDYPFALETDLMEMLSEKPPMGNPFGSVDSALYYSLMHYVAVTTKIFLKVVDPAFLWGMNWTLGCTELTAAGAGKFKATFHMTVDIDHVVLLERDFAVSLEFQEVNGELHLNMKRMKLRCRRDVETAARKIARKISRMDV